MIKLRVFCLLIGFCFLGVSYAADIKFSDECPPNTGEDCSEAFTRVVENASITGQAIYFDEGSYNIRKFQWSGDKIEQLRIKGASKELVSIKTDGLMLRRINSLYLEDITIEGYHHLGTGDALIMAGMEWDGSVGKSELVSIENVIFKDAGLNLLSVKSAKSLYVNNSVFDDAGSALKPVKAENKIEGNGIVIENVDFGEVTNNKFSRIRRGGILLTQNVSDMRIDSNVFELKTEDERYYHPTYDRLGGTCLYVAMNNGDGLVFSNNVCKDYFIQGVRMQSFSSIDIVNNHFNHDKDDDPDCKRNNYQAPELPGDKPGDKENYKPIGIKIHRAKDSDIIGNCIADKFTLDGTGILIESNAKGVVDNILIKDNTIRDAKFGVRAKIGNYSGSYNRLIIEGNVIRGVTETPIKLRYGVPKTDPNYSQPQGSSIVLNTISQSNNYSGAWATSGIEIKGQKHISIDNNWMFGCSQHTGDRHISFHDTDNSVVKNNTLITANCEPGEKIGGIHMDEDSDNNNTYNNTYSNITEEDHYYTAKGRDNTDSGHKFNRY